MEVQRAAIEATAMDMWEPYVPATRPQVPAAEEKIVFDRFHCAKHLNEDVDRVRRAEHREIQARGDTRLAGTKYDWLRHPARFSGAAQWRAFGALPRRLPASTAQSSSSSQITMLASTGA